MKTNKTVIIALSSVIVVLIITIGVLASLVVKYKTADTDKERTAVSTTSTTTENVTDEDAGIHIELPDTPIKTLSYESLNGYDDEIIVLDDISIDSVGETDAVLSVKVSVEGITKDFNGHVRYKIYDADNVVVHDSRINFIISPGEINRETFYPYHLQKGETYRLVFTDAID